MLVKYITTKGPHKFLYNLSPNNMEEALFDYLYQKSDLLTIQQIEEDPLGNVIKRKLLIEGKAVPVLAKNQEESQELEEVKEFHQKVVTLYAGD